MPKLHILHDVALNSGPERRLRAPHPPLAAPHEPSVASLRPRRPIASHDLDGMKADTKRCTGIRSAHFKSTFETLGFQEAAVMLHDYFVGISHGVCKLSAINWHEGGRISPEWWQTV